MIVHKKYVNMFMIYNIIIYLFTAIGSPPGGSGYFTCKRNIKLVTTEFKSGGLHEKHGILGTISAFAYRHRETEKKPVSRLHIKVCLRLSYNTVYQKPKLIRGACFFLWSVTWHDYGLDGPGSNPVGDEIFRPSRPALGPTQPPVKWLPRLSRV